MTELEIPVPADVVQATPETEFASYLAFVRNSVGSRMFRNFFVERDGQMVDALRDGGLSCAFFVSSVLTIFKKIGSFHTTVASTVRDLERSGWRRVDLGEPCGPGGQDLMPGDVLVWEAELIGGEWHAHIGFYVGDGQAVSNAGGTPTLHRDHPNHPWSSITRAYRLPLWTVGAEPLAGLAERLQ